jgi:RNA polymerase sigma factor (TIGR02999 family)
MKRSAGAVTVLLRAWGQGDDKARDALVPLVYSELRRLARRQMRGEGRPHTLAPTGLVHEAYLRLFDQRDATWENRAHFFAVAAQMMRRVLVDQARARRAAKRGGGEVHLSLDDTEPEARERGVDLCRLLRGPERRGDRARPRHLARHRQARVAMARAWLRREVRDPRRHRRAARLDASARPARGQGRRLPGRPRRGGR